MPFRYNALTNNLDLTEEGGTASIEGPIGTVLQGTGIGSPAEFSTATYPSAAGADGNVLTSDGTNWVSEVPAGGGVTSVSGTADRVTSTGGTTPVLDIAATYVGQTSITTLGTVATGTWSATTIAVNKGGTGVATLTGVLTGNGTGNVTGNAVTQYGVVIGGASNAVASTAVGSAGQILRSGGAGVNPAYTTSTYPTTNAVSTLLYASSANVMGALATANNGVLVTSNTGVPSLLAAPAATGRILQSNSAAAPSFSTATYPSTAGTSGNVLTSDGTNVVSSAPGFKLIQTQSVTAVSQVDFTSGFGSYTNLFVVVTLTPQTSGSAIGMRQSTNAGSTWTSNFSWGLNYFIFNSTTNTNINNNASTPMQLSDAATNNGAFPVNASINISNFNTAYSLAAMFDSAFVDVGIGGWRRGVGLGIGAASVNALRFQATAGTVTGTISVYGRA